ncbi:hypothetical protein IE983_24855 [Enterobacter hormaechei]|uniref:Uncharacterized protein n=1 Tax=Enterobacter hormaechei TaxID=158836 RepID=A0A927DMM7_9ENTR|nr:hypothetical protein [Enterobacter hormaechei]
MNAALPDALPLGFPLIPGALTLSVAQLARLRPEDVLLPTRASFSPRRRRQGAAWQPATDRHAERRGGPRLFTLSDLGRSPL